MSLTAAVIRELISAGLSGEALASACERIEATAAPARTARQERNARYYVRKSDVSTQEWDELRRIVFMRDGFVCQYCEADVSCAPQCDHIVPLAAGGRSTPENLTTACKRCNSSKRDTPLEVWMSACL